MSGRLAGRRVLVTGAASGMGRGIADLFAQEGATVARLDRNREGLAEVGDVTSVCDVTDRVGVAAAIGAAADALGGLDGIVCAAGVLATATFGELTGEQWDRMIAVNLTGVFNVVDAALPHLRAAGRATIVNIASASGTLPLPGTSGYSATKAGLMMFTKCLGMDLAPAIRVNCICPGVIRTEMTRYIWESAEHTARATERVALQRLGEVDDVARAALFLSTDDSAFTTGAAIPVDGGFAWP